jgi:hypothetical protein
MAERQKPSRGRSEPSYEITTKVQFDFALDEEKLASIRKCIEQGKLTITLNKMDVTKVSEGARAGDGYQYD